MRIFVFLECSWYEDDGRLGWRCETDFSFIPSSGLKSTSDAIKQEIFSDGCEFQLTDVSFKAQTTLHCGKNPFAGPSGLTLLQALEEWNETRTEEAALIFPEVLRVFVSLPTEEDGFPYSATPRKSKKDMRSDDSSSGTSASCENSSTRKIRGARVQQLDVNGFRKQNRQLGRSDSADAVGILKY